MYQYQVQVVSKTFLLSLCWNKIISGISVLYHIIMYKPPASVTASWAYFCYLGYAAHHTYLVLLVLVLNIIVWLFLQTSHSTWYQVDIQ